MLILVNWAWKVDPDRSAGTHEAQVHEGQHTNPNSGQLFNAAVFTW